MIKNCRTYFLNFRIANIKIILKCYAFLKDYFRNTDDTVNYTQPILIDDANDIKMMHLQEMH